MARVQPGRSRVMAALRELEAQEARAARKKKRASQPEPAKTETTTPKKGRAKK
jgi:hypothetical protein